MFVCYHGFMTARTAHPYKDLAVIDARAPRFNQLVVALLSLTATLTDAWPLWGLLAAQLTIGLLFGRQYCLPCVAYFEFVQPRLGEGPLEDARAPRFANIIGAAVLTSATLAHLFGLHQLGWALGLLVAVLASLAVVTNICVGCEMYRLIAKLRGIRGKEINRIDLAQLGVTPSSDFILSFSHPLCSDCQQLEKRVTAEGKTLVTVDISKHKDLAEKYGITLVPLAWQVNAQGQVLARVA